MTTIPNPPSTGDEFTNELTGVTYRYDGEKWLAVSSPVDESVEALTERVANGETKQSEIENTIADALVVQANKVDKTGDTMTGRLTAPRIAVDSDVLESGRVFEAKFQGETNAWINANGQVRSNFVLDDDSEFKTLTTKQYVDDKVGGADYLPLTGGTLTGTTRITGASFFVQNADGDEVIRLQETGFVRSLDMFRCQRDGDGPAFQARIGTEANAEIRTNGSAFFKGTVNMNSNKITNVLTPTSDNDAANKSYVDTTVTGFATETYVDNAIEADASHLSISGGTLDGSLQFKRGDKEHSQFKVTPNSGSDNYATNIYSLNGGQMRFRTSHTGDETNYNSHIILSPDETNPTTKIYHVVESGDSAAVPKSYVDEKVASSGGGVPVGSIMIWMNSTAPAGWFKLQGGTFDVDANPLLHAYLQNTEGYTSGRLPNWSGRYPGEYGNHLTYGLGTQVDYETARPKTPFTTDNPGNHKHRYGNTDFGGGATHSADDARNKSKYETDAAGAHTHTITGGGDSTTRPRTVVVHYIIKGD